MMQPTLADVRSADWDERIAILFLLSRIEQALIKITPTVQFHTKMDLPGPSGVRILSNHTQLYGTLPREFDPSDIRQTFLTGHFLLPPVTRDSFKAQ